MRQLAASTAAIVERLLGRASTLLVALILLSLVAAPASAAVVLGNNGIGGSQDTGDSNYLNGSKVTAGSTGLLVTSMSVFVGAVDTAPNNRYQVAIYTDSNGTPGTLVAASGAGTLIANAWNTLPLSATLQPNSSYWLMYNANGRTSTVNNMYYNAGSAGGGAYSSSTVPFGSWPGNFGPATVTIAVYSLYVTAESGAVDPTPPSVAVTAPGQGATVSGIVTVSAGASDNIGVGGVRFKVDQLDLGGEVTAAPYTVAWNTALTANGPHTLTAVARDTSGNITTSAPVTVTVLNADPRSTVGEWSPLMSWPLVAIHASLLKTGKVLVWDEQDTVTQPRLWDPATLAFTNTPLVDNELFCSGHTQLADGRLLVAGGHLAHAGEVGIKSTYQYLPDTNTWTRTGDMVYDRWYPALTRLSDGRVAIFSGQITTGVFADTPEIYDPASGLTTPLTTLSTPELREEEYPINFPLPSGKVLAISPEHGPVQIFDPAATTWTNLNTTPVRFGSAVQYRPGRILMSGGGAAFLLPADSQAAVLDVTASTPAWQSTSPMSFGRYMHHLVMLPAGEVLAIGGSSIVDEQATSGGSLPIEMWDPDTEVWTTLAALEVPRMYHSTALLLPDGRVLAAGGGHNAAAPNQFSAQVYSPPYLFKGPRPSIVSAPDVVTYGSSTFVVDTPDAATISTVSLVALGSVTHSTDMNQFYAQLPFTISGNQLAVAAPSNGDQVVPGYYMLFIVDGNRVPSVAKILRVGESLPPPPPPPPPTTTLGLTTVGGDQDSGDSNYLNGSRVTVGSTGLLMTSMSVFIGAVDAAPNNRYQVAIYTDSNGTPGTLVATSGAGTLIANAWNTLPLAATLQPNSSYWLMYNTNGQTGAVNNMYYNAGSAGGGAYSNSAVPFGSWPGNFGPATLTTAVYSLYATFGP